MTTDPEQAMLSGSPELATLILTLGGVILGRAFVGRSLVTGVIRRESRTADPLA